MKSVVQVNPEQIICLTSDKIDVASLIDRDFGDAITVYRSDSLGRPTTHLLPGVS